MKTIIILLSLITSLSSCIGQTFTDYLDGIPLINHPKKFSESSYSNWTGYDIPTSISSLPKFTGYKTIAKINLDGGYPLLLVRKHYNNGYDRLISLISFDTDGNYLSDLDAEYTADGEGGEFAISPEGKIRIATYNLSDAKIKTFRYENGYFIQEGVVEDRDADNLGDY